MHQSGNVIRRLRNITLRECHLLIKNPIYLFCMVAFPLLIVFFFTSLLSAGLPSDMPIGIVDQDQTSTTRNLIRRLDAFQNTHVAAYYNNVNDARNAMQRGDIYAFMHFPKGTTERLLSSRQPKVAFYYDYSYILAGSLLYRDLRVISTLGSAAVGRAKLRAGGYTEDQIVAFLQPIAIDTHPTENPWINYNYYLSTTIIPGCIMLFIFLITAYSLGTELKFDSGKQLLKDAHDNIHIALLGKLIPQACIFLLVVFFYLFYVFEVLHFPHECSRWALIPYGIGIVASAQAFGIFAFGLFPSLRMSLSICSLWGVISFSISGFAFPCDAMDAPLQFLAWLFPLRSLFMIYQMQILNGVGWLYVLPYYVVLSGFMILPIFVFSNIKRAMKEFVYIP